LTSGLLGAAADALLSATIWSMRASKYRMPSQFSHRCEYALRFSFGREFVPPSAGRVVPAAARASPSMLTPFFSEPVLRRMPSCESPPVL
jgi:hypothetical protein